MQKLPISNYYGSLPSSRFLDVTQRSPKRKLLGERCVTSKKRLRGRLLLRRRQPQRLKTTGGLEHTTTDFCFLFLDMNKVLKNSTRHDWDKLIHWRSLHDAKKFERPQIHFLATFSLLSSFLNFPNLGSCQFTSHPWCNVIYSSSLFYGLLSGLGSLLRMFCFLCFTSAVSNKLYYTGDEPNLPSFFFIY